MVTGHENPTPSHNRSWKDLIAIALDEAMTALEESFHDLSHQQVWHRPLPDRHSIGTMVMHCLANLNDYGCWVQTNEGVEEAQEEPWFDMWKNDPGVLDAEQKGRQLPEPEQMVAWLHRARQKVTEGLATATEADLRGPRAGEDWCRQFGRTTGDAYARTVFHTMAHVRQIWCLRGVMGAYGATNWPFQHYA